MNTPDEIDQLIREKRVYFVGEKLPLNWYEAVVQWMPLAEAGDAKAQYNIGRCYGNGDGIDKDKQQELAWLLKAAAQNEPRSHFNLHLYYEDAKDDTQAASWLEKAAALGEIRAVEATAHQALAVGDTELAKQCYQKSADEGREIGTQGLIVCGLNLVGVQRKNNGIFEFSLQNNSPYRASVSLQCKRSYSDFERSDSTSLIELAPGELKVINGLSEMLLGSKAISEMTVMSANSLTFLGIRVARELKPGESSSMQIQINGQSSIVWDHTYFEIQPRLVWEKSGPCFVLTACYENFDAPTVLQFRQFRDNHLTRFRLGKAFIAWYYTHGPKMAQAISDKPRIKAVFRRVFNSIAKLLP